MSTKREQSAGIDFAMHAIEYALSNQDGLDDNEIVALINLQFAFGRATNDIVGGRMGAPPVDNTLPFRTAARARKIAAILDVTEQA